jgi:hypothetical protein
MDGNLYGIESVELKKSAVFVGDIYAFLREILLGQ